MIQAINSALAGLYVHRTWLDSSADNIANSRTDGFRSTRVLPRENSSGAPSPYVVRSTTPGPVYGDVFNPGELVERSNVDLALEGVNLIIAEKGYQANLQVLRMADQLTGTTLDIIA